MKSSKANKTGAFVLFIFAVAVGAWLRLHLLPSQILLDDEWHGVMEVIGKSTLDILTHFNPKDNSSPPLNLYNLFLLRTVGWSELMLRLPALVAGLVTVILLPLMVKRSLKGRVWLIFAFLLALSPVLIFYSRFARAYSIMALTGFSVLLLICQWLKTGRRGYAIGFTVLTALSIYLHLFSAVLAFIPLLVAMGCKIAARMRGPFVSTLRIAVPFSTVTVWTAATGGVSLIFAWPMLLQSTELPWAQGAFTLEGVLTAWMLLSGTSSLVASGFFLVLCSAGIVFLLQRDSVLGLIFLLTVFSYLAALLISRPNGISAGLVLIRYMIVVVPVALASAAVALERLFLYMEGRSSVSGNMVILAIAVFLVSLYVTGPLPAIYASPNNFTNHSAFQGGYRKILWERSESRQFQPAFSIRADEIPPFYQWLQQQADIGTIIEYPFDICNFNNLYYFYQHFHRKRVLAGYVAAPALSGNAVVLSPDRPEPPDRQYSLGMRSVDEILSGVAEPQRLAFTNMVDLASLPVILSSGADVVVLHQYLTVLRVLPDGTDFVPVTYFAVPRLAEKFQRAWGGPLYEDGQIICFRVRRAS